MTIFSKNFFNVVSKLIIIAFLVIFLLILFYAIYRSNFFPDNISSRYFKYYVISFFGLCFYLFTLFLSDNLQRWISFLSLLFILFIASVEIVLDKMEVPKGLLKEKILIANKLKIDYDTRSATKVINDLNDKGVDIVASVYPQSFIHTDGIPNQNIFPLSGVSNKKTLHCNEAGQWVSHMSDKHGFSNSNIDWEKNKIDFLVLGDQFPQGACVNQDKSIPEIIKKISKKSLLNLSMVGNGPLLQLATLKEYGVGVNPKKVLWFYYEGNDLVDELPREKSSPVLLNYLKKDFKQGLSSRQKEIDKKIYEFSKKEKMLWKTRIFRLHNLRSFLKFDSEHIDYKVTVDPLFIQILQEAKKTVAAWEGEIYFIYVPQYERYKGNIADKWRKGEVIELVKSLDLRIIDLDKDLIFKHEDPLSFYPLRMHGTFVSQANSLIANFIVKSINRD